MKHLLLIVLFVSPISARQIVLDIPDEDIAIVENDVVDAEEWILGAWTGKLNKCKERFIKAEVDESVKEGTAIPAGEEAIIQKRFSRPGYESRKQRDEREKREKERRP